MIKKFLIVFTLILASSFPAFSQQVLLSDLISQFEQALQSEELTEANCHQRLEDAFAAIEELTPKNVVKDEITASGNVLIKRVSDARVNLHKSIQKMSQGTFLPDDCLDSYRRVDMAGRYLIDYLYQMTPEEKRPGQWLSAEEFEFTDPAKHLQTGDVIVSRGDAISSAGIAHMGRVDGMFSHNALVYKDPRSGKIYTVESYIERGTLVQTLDKFMKSGIGRLVVMRHKNKDLRERAAKAAYRRVKKGRKIKYDDAFRTDDHERIFCSELIRWAFGPLINEPHTVPYQMTVFPLEENPAFFSQMGIDVNIAFAPSDMIYDPNFDYVAEYRKIHRIKALRYQDIIADGMYTLMEEQGYRLKPTKKIKRFLNFARFLRKIPLIGLSVRKKLSSYVSKKFLYSAYTLDLVGNKLLDDLVVAVEQKEKVTGDFLTPYEMMDEFLRLVREDAVRAKIYGVKKSTVHEIFRPENF